MSEYILFWSEMMFCAWGFQFTKGKKIKNKNKKPNNGISKCFRVCLDLWVNGKNHRLIGRHPHTQYFTRFPSLASRGQALSDISCSSSYFRVVCAEVSVTQNRTGYQHHRQWGSSPGGEAAAGRRCLPPGMGERGYVTAADAQLKDRSCFPAGFAGRGGRAKKF